MGQGGCGKAHGPGSVLGWCINYSLLGGYATWWLEIMLRVFPNTSYGPGILCSLGIWFNVSKGGLRTWPGHCLLRVSWDKVHLPQLQWAAGHLDRGHLQLLRCGSLPRVWLHPSGSVQAGSPLQEPALFCC